MLPPMIMPRWLDTELKTTAPRLKRPCTFSRIGCPSPSPLSALPSALPSGLPLANRVAPGNLTARSDLAPIPPIPPIAPPQVLKVLDNLVLRDQLTRSMAAIYGTLDSSLRLFSFDLRLVRPALFPLLGMDNELRRYLPAMLGISILHHTGSRDPPYHG